MTAPRAEVHVALLTPADAEGGLDAGALDAHVRWLAAAGVDGLLIAGTTGEGPLLDDEEVVAAVRCAVEAAPGLQIVAGAGRPATRATVRLSLAARAAGATAVAVVVPYFFAFADDQLLRHFATVAEAVAPLPVIAYTIPVRTHNELSPQLLERLAAAGIAGIKDSTKSFERHLQYLEVARRTGLRAYMGSDAFAQPALEAGTSGLMSAVANVLPAQVVGLRDAVAAGESERARTLQGEIAAFRAGNAAKGTVAALKDELRRRLERYPTALRAPLG